VEGLDALKLWGLRGLLRERRRALLVLVSFGRIADLIERATSTLSVLGRRRPRRPSELQKLR
jgi:hypothetical protein